MAGAQHGPLSPRKYIHPLAQTHLVDRRLAVLVSQSAGDFVRSHCVPMWDGVSVDTVFHRIIRAVAIWTYSGGSFSILVCAHCRSQEYAIGEMPSPVFMK